MVYLQIKSRLLKTWNRYGEELWAASLFAAYALILFTHHSPASLTDYGDWTYEGVLLRNRLLCLPDPTHILKHYPVPNSLGTIGIALFALIFSWHLAAKLWLAVLFLLSFLVSKHMICSCGGKNLLWLIAPGAIFLNVNLWYGFINFQIGICFTVLIASLLLRQETREWLFGTLLTVTFFAHMIPFVFASLLLILYSWQYKKLKLLWQLVPGVLLSIWYMVGRFAIAHNADGNAGMIGAVSTYSAAFWAYKVNSYLKSFGFINPGNELGSISVRVFGSAGYLVLFLLNALLCGAIAWCFCNAAASAYRNRKPERFVWTAAITFLPLYLLVPATLLGVSDPGSRLLQTALGVTLFLSMGESDVGRVVIRGAAACAVVLQLAALCLFAEIPFSAAGRVGTIEYIPHAVVVFAHIPNHAEDSYYRALEENDVSLKVFPTATFLNKPNARTPLQ